ncbi:MAG: glycosyltransferase [Candidatus Solibacter sp.]
MDLVSRRPGGGKDPMGRSGSVAASSRRSMVELATSHRIGEDALSLRLQQGDAEPLVSVVLPVYNGERFVSQTIESALRQTYRNLEIIVVDDGSTDQTASLIQGIATRDARVRIFHQPNSGVARARNRGLEESRGEFVAPLDSDDLWDPAKIEEQVRIMQQSGDGVGLVYCWWVWIDENGVVLDRSPSWEIEGDASALLLQVNYTGNASVPLYRRKYLQEAGGYDESMEQRGGRGCEDWDVALKVAAKYRVAVARQLLVGYRRLPDSMSTQYDEMWRSRQLLISGALERDPDLKPQLLRRSTDQFALYVAGVLFRSGAYVRSFRWAARAWRTGLIFRVLPYVVRALGTLAWSRRSRSGPVMTPGIGLDSSAIPPPLIPYDRIYPAKPIDGAGNSSGILKSKIIQILFVILAFLFLAGLHRDDDGLAFQGDSPRHAINGLFWYDMATSGTTDFIGFATRYYARYPVINPIVYPPLFYLLEGCAFRVFGPTPYAAKALVVLFGIMAGCYSMAWARRWLGPAYGWAGVFLAFMPGVVIWSATVMLNVPAMALGLASLYHARSWVECGGGKRVLICGAFCAATVFTYYQGGIAIAIGLAWAPFLRANRDRSRGAVAIVAVALLAAIPILIAGAFAPTFLQRNVPSLAKVMVAETFTFYLLSLPGLVGAVPVALGALGIVLGIRTAQWRKEAQLVALWILVPLAVFSLLPAKDSRYVLIVAPAFLFGSAIGIACLAAKYRPLPAVWQSTVLIVALAGSAWSASRVPTLHKSGFRAIALYLRQHAPEEAILYDGYHDGLFGFYLRAFDPDFRRRLVLGQQVLYHFGPAATFNWEEALSAGSSADVVRLLQTESGCRWLAIEVGTNSQWAKGQRLLRNVVTGPEFELVRSFPVVAPNATRVDLYRQVGAVTPKFTIDLKMTSLGEHTFRSVRPITR